MHLSIWKPLILAAIVFTAGFAQGVTIDMVPVGNPGNLSDAYGYGSVSYVYSISRCEITAGQYTEFLNAVAGDFDPYGLYNPEMSTSLVGSKITKNGAVYTASLPDQPVNNVSWGDAARFCNWLQTGTTENGAYTLGGHTDYPFLAAVPRNPEATYCIPTANEWFKAAYYDPNKGGEGVGGYWLYATQSDTLPTNVYPSLGTNNANYYNNAYTLGAEPWTTPVGSFANSVSAYGTLDQSGNIKEWNESSGPPSSMRGLLGGSFEKPYDPSNRIGSSDHARTFPHMEYYNLGFRIASIPEPSALALLLTSSLGGLLLWRRRR